MKLSVFHHQHHPMILNCPLTLTRTHKRLNNKGSYRWLPCHCSHSSTNKIAAEPVTVSLSIEGRRALLSCLLTTVVGVYACDVAGAVSTSRRALRGAKIPESDYTTLPNGLKYYDLKVGNGAEAKKGSRVAVRTTSRTFLKRKLSQYSKLVNVFTSETDECIFCPELHGLMTTRSKSEMSQIHYVAKWKSITFMTSRQGMGVGGGTPYGFDVGQSERGTVLKGLDLGVQGMRVGGQRLLIVPPELAYGSKGVQEIPPNSTIELDIELLSIKQSPFGTPVKIVEG
ncbi:Peptidyl-prolyl cis-trans isomerase FKBP16-4, chloroplastic [Glycine max]|nr:Peptidyl-prolyl cis-trans isomerase FKBP16-4, chloroplastic [Glycine max]